MAESVRNHFTFEKLEGISNYNEWKFAMRMYLVERKLWQHVREESQNAALNEMALTVIVSGIKPHLYPDVMEETTGLGAWARLEKLYQVSTFDRKVSLLTELTNTRFSECRNMAEYVQKKITTAQKLKSINVDFDDETLAGLILAGLPEDYQPLIMALKNCGDTITPDLVRSKLLQESGRRSESTKETVLKAKTDYRARKDVFRGNCNLCKKYGHMARDCRNKKIEKTKSAEKTDERKKEVYIGAFLTSTDKSKWIIDSGASKHMTSNRKWLKNFKQTPSVPVQTGDGTLQTCGVGDISLKLRRNNETVEVTFTEVLYVPNLSANLLSIRHLDKKKEISAHFHDDICELKKKDGFLVATGRAIGESLYTLDLADENAFSITQPKHDLWHQRLGHLGKRNMCLLEKMATGYKYTDNENICTACIKGKHHRNPFPKGRAKRAEEKLELVHSDVCGPMSTVSLGGARFCLVFIDDYSRFSWVYLLKQKSEVVDRFREFKARVERETGSKLKTLRTDRGTEYVNHELDKILKDDGIQHQLSISHTPQQNGVAERANRTLVEKARSMLENSGLDKQYWGEAIATANYCRNRSPTIALKNKTPFESWTKMKPDLSHLRVFGCKAFAHVPKEKRKKWDSKSEELLFTGYCTNSKGYRLVNPVTHIVVESRDVIFIENELLSHEGATRSMFEFCEFPETIVENPVEENLQEKLDAKDGLDVVDDQSILEVEQEKGEKIETRSHLQRNRKLPSKFNEFLMNVAETVETALCIEDLTTTDPRSPEEALQRHDAEEWKRAMKIELDSLIKNETWDIVDLPAGKRSISSKWIFKIKRNADGSIERYKARLVARGYTQIEGIDFEESFSPVVRYETLRVLLALSALHNWDIDHMDAIMAFTQPNMEDEVYLQPPRNFEIDGKKIGSKVLHLQKPLYGLKQAGRAWFMALDKTLFNLKLKRAHFDACVYVRNDENKLVIVAVYVDDILIFSNDTALKDSVKSNLMMQFEMKDLGEIKHCLGMRITRDRQNGTITIDQERYVNEILKKHSMSDCNPMGTPLDSNQKLTRNVCPEKEDEKKEMKKIPYQSAVGSLLYAALGTRPDIAYAINVLCQYSSNPGMPHWSAVKRVMRYLRGTTNSKIVYSKNGNLNITGFCDASYADRDEAKSTTGYVFVLGGGAITWSSKKQSVVAMSTTEAEYIALSFAAREATWLRGILMELKLVSDNFKIEIFEDNKAATDLTKNEIFHARTKHIGTFHHYSREAVRNGVITVSKINTERMIADSLTKSVKTEKHVFCKLGMGVK